jgi:hypothetical protein
MIERFEAISKVTRTVELSSMISLRLTEVSKMSFDFSGSSPVTRSIILYSSLGIEEL